MKPQPIHADAVYALAEFKHATGLGDAAIRTARRHGLAVRRVGGRAFVLGSDWLAFLRGQDCAECRQEGGAA